ncbi:alginate lyase family protein [Paenibacillus soyae]|uniref:Alginate lyase family protein n=1 Tax=Paenibacillus soyae TaxID=2969249 RepID=A0A9X2MQA5_9BACL|nr:alginate lyase family protein [Paenibacillus soyae]MCR2803898.1 alginate lyase family protein [Paenibacillus soyae]
MNSHSPTARDHLLRLADESLSAPCHAVSVWTIPGFYFDAAGHQAAKRLMEADAQAAYATALAFRMTGEPAYADKAVELIDGWASVNRGLAGLDGPLVSAYLGVGFIQAALMIDAYEGWQRVTRERFIRWMTSVCLPAWEGIPLRNNWQSWGLYARLSLFRLVGDHSRLADGAERLKEHIDESLARSGFLPEETLRGTKSVWYHYFALAPLTAAAKQVLDVTGEDLFRWISPSGNTIKKALDTLLHYVDGRADEWPYDKGQEVPSPLSAETWPLDLFEAMACMYGEPAYERFVAPHRPIMGHINRNNGYFQSYAWVFPALRLQVEGIAYRSRDDR